MPRYWLTTQWPPLYGIHKQPPPGVYLRNGTKLKSFPEKDDLVVIYETGNGPPAYKDGIKYPRMKGQSAAIALGKVTSVLSEAESDGLIHEGNASGWKRHADLNLFFAGGAIPWTILRPIISFKTNATPRFPNGLKEILKSEFEAVMKTFGASLSQIENPQILEKKKEDEFSSIPQCPSGANTVAHEALWKCAISLTQKRNWFQRHHLKREWESQFRLDVFDHDAAVKRWLMGMVALHLPFFECRNEEIARKREYRVLFQKRV